jgi:hypothetical protein
LLRNDTPVELSDYFQDPSYGGVGVDLAGEGIDTGICSLRPCNSGGDITWFHHCGDKRGSLAEMHISASLGRTAIGLEHEDVVVLVEPAA